MNRNGLVKPAQLGLMILLLCGLVFPCVGNLSAADRETHNVLGIFGSTSS